MIQDLRTYLSQNRLGSISNSGVITIDAFNDYVFTVWKDLNDETWHNSFNDKTVSEICKHNRMSHPLPKYAIRNTMMDILDYLRESVSKPLDTNLTDYEKLNYIKHCISVNKQCSKLQSIINELLYNSIDVSLDEHSYKAYVRTNGEELCKHLNPSN